MADRSSLHGHLTPVAVGLARLDRGAGRERDQGRSGGIAVEIGGVREPAFLLRGDGGGEQQRGHHAGW
jgi:hypothetical protein